MNKRFLASIISAFVVVWWIVSPLSLSAKPRSEAQLRSIASSAIRAAGKRFAPANSGAMKVVRKENCLALVGYQDGAYAVVTLDDELPAVIGISTTPYSGGRNANLEWWIATMEKTLKVALESKIPMKVTTPDPSKYPTSVEPLMTSKWSQGVPYNGYLPEGIYTGCVATAMAQVLNYHKSPVHGYGQSSVKVTTTVYTNRIVTATFADDYYDWDNMLDEYTTFDAGTTQGNAVALLMRDCGVAAKMNYGGDDEGGSGAYLWDAADGLRQYFGFQKAEYLARENFSEPAWMNRIYKELSTRGPIIYGGADITLYAGHAFVLHGYRQDGKVYVNWGWAGEDDGWYDVPTLAMPGYSFADQQDMIVGVYPVEKYYEDADLTLTAPGTLASMLPDDASEKIGTLRLKGEINSSDLLTIRQLAGIDSNMQPTNGSLMKLDISEARIVAGGNPFLIDGDNQLTTSPDCLPERAFYGCTSLQEISLPKSIRSMGTGALAGMPGLKTVNLPDEAKEYITCDDHFVYSDASKTVVTNLLPSADNAAEIIDDVVEIAPYAFDNTRIASLRLGKNVQRIGNFALNRCRRLMEIRITSKDYIPALGPNSLSGISFTDSKLYVPTGMKETYASVAGWKNFKGTIDYYEYDNIVEYGTMITVRNVVRDYGDANPAFGYVVLGETPEGEPVITCEADASSPVGTYIISIEKGSLTGDDIFLKEGTLYINPVQLTARLAHDYEREVGEENPEFVIEYDGFRLTDGEEVVLTPPTATTDATADSPVGEYVVRIEGGETNGNYEFNYVNGLLRVKEKTETAISQATNQSTSQSAIYDLQGRKVLNTKSRTSPAIYIKGGKKTVVR